MKFLDSAKIQIDKKLYIELSDNIYHNKDAWGDDQASPIVQIKMMYGNRVIYEAFAFIERNILEFCIPPIGSKLFRKYNLPYRKIVYDTDIASEFKRNGKGKNTKVKCLNLGHEITYKVFKEILNRFKQRSYNISKIKINRESGLQKNKKNRIYKIGVV